MFENARIKLTLWYLLIIMIVSGFFSLVVYLGFTKELGRGFRMQSLRGVSQGQVVVRDRMGFQRILPFIIYPDDIAPEEYLEIIDYAKKRFAMQLIIINGGIFILAGTAGYFLAGKTLHPIEVALEEQKRFVADASHEFKTPLTALRTSIEVALRDKNMDLKSAKKVLKESLSDIESLGNLSNNLLSMARFQKDSNFSNNIIELKEVINNSVKKITPFAKSNSIKIITHLVPLTVKGNEENLNKLFSILLDNAIKYSNRGGKVTISSFKKTKHAVVTVEDTGIGISKKDTEHIFERFYRADSSRSKRGVTGFGLGLSLAKQIVSQLNGTISVLSELGKGSKFTIKLPLS